MTVKKRYHSALDLKHALINWSPQDFEASICEPDGRLLSAPECRALMVDLISRGTFFLLIAPDDDPCEGWHKKKGCPGHPVPDFIHPDDPQD